WHNPEKTKAEFRADGFFITGDLGRFEPNGYVSIVGRGKDLIISGGFNIYPRSEEHTSELQSLTNLVCRLLLEKKKNNVTPSHVQGKHIAYNMALRTE